jgi:hypothetical protein
MTSNAPAEPSKPESDPPFDDVSWGQWFGMALLATGILAGLEFMVYRALAPVERGEPQGAAVWTPIAIVYELCGYAAALSVIPALWAILMSIVSWQTWKRVRAERAAVENKS